jgi:hypothetical protein
MAVFRGTRGEIHGVLRFAVGSAFAAGFGDGSGCCYKALIALAEKQPSSPYDDRVFPYGFCPILPTERVFHAKGQRMQRRKGFRAEERRKGGALRAGLFFHVNPEASGCGLAINDLLPRRASRRLNKINKTAGWREPVGVHLTLLTTDGSPRGSTKVTDGEVGDPSGKIGAWRHAPRHSRVSVDSKPPIDIPPPFLLPSARNISGCNSPRACGGPRRVPSLRSG